MSGKMRILAVLAAVALLGATLVSPVGAHVGGTVSHLWTEHIKPKVDANYTGETFILVSRDTVGAGSFNAVRVLCPGTHEAIAGGVDLDNVFTMVVTSSGPVFGESRLIQTEAGRYGSAEGWQASARNNSESTQDIAVSVTCAKR